MILRDPEECTTETIGEITLAAAMLIKAVNMSDGTVELDEPIVLEPGTYSIGWDMCSDPIFVRLPLN